MSKKKIAILVIVLLAVAAGTVYGLMKLRKANTKAYVQPVSDLNNTWALESGSSSGTITQSAYQKITLSEEESVAEVFVEEGQAVKAGQSLFRYDTKKQDLVIKERQIDVDDCAKQLSLARKQLAQYKKIKPVKQKSSEKKPKEFKRSKNQAFLKLIREPIADDEPSGSDTDDPDSSGSSATPGSDSGSGDTPDPSGEGGEGGEGSGQTPEPQPEPEPEPEPEPDPEASAYLYQVKTSTKLTAAEINAWVNKGMRVILKIKDDKGNYETVWEIDGKNFPPAEAGTYWNVVTHQRWEPPAPKDPDDPGEEYTKAEKDALIAEQNLTIKDLENDLALAQHELDREKMKLDKSVVKAVMNGTVETIYEAGYNPGEGNPFCTVIGEQGTTVTGYISELDLGTTSIGDKITVTSWMSGATTEAEIITISDFPATAGYWGGSGNPNASYYEFTAYMEDSTGFEPGEDVNIQPYMEDMDQMIVLEKVYVRMDDQGAYVMADDGTGHLARKAVEVKPASDNEYIIITSGLTEEDLIAFPYGVSGKEGALTTTEEQWDDLLY